MIKSTQKQTKHILVSLMNYTVDCNDSEFHKYEFGYLQIDDLTLDKISEFRSNWGKGIRREEKQYFVLLNPITLIESKNSFPF